MTRQATRVVLNEAPRTDERDVSEAARSSVPGPDPVALAASPANVVRLREAYRTRPAVISIVGRPATGKSTLAVAMVQAFGYPAMTNEPGLVGRLLPKVLICRTHITWCPRLIAQRGKPLPWPADVAVYTILCRADDDVRAGRIRARYELGVARPADAEWMLAKPEPGVEADLVFDTTESPGSGHVVEATRAWLDALEHASPPGSGA